MTVKTFKDLTTGTSIATTDVMAVSNPTTGALKKLTITGMGINGNVRHYGAVGDASTDDTAAITACLAANGFAFFPPGTYLVTSTIALSSGQSLVGVGHKSIIRAQLNSNLFTLAGANHVHGIRFEYASGGGTSTVYLSAGSTNNHQISDCYFFNSPGHGIKAVGNDGSHNGGNVSNCLFTSCLIGFEAGAVAEYWNIVGSRFHTCGTGIKNGGGNNQFIGCEIANCTTGFSLVAGSNDGHSMAVGCSINHCVTLAVSASGIDEGYRFIGCMIYYGGINIANCDRILFESCDIAELTFTGNTCTNTAITGGGAVSNVTFSLTSCPVLGYEIGNSGLQVRDFGAATTTLIKPVLADYADNAAAVSGGLAVGTFYRSTDAVKVVH